MEILNKYKTRKIHLKPIYDDYWDFVLSLDNSPTYEVKGDDVAEKGCLSAYIDFSNPSSHQHDYIKSAYGYEWDKAENEGIVSSDYGFTGMDNGQVLFDKGTITNREFYKLLTESILTTENYGRALFLAKVSGNTQDYSYPLKYDVEGGFYTFKGGFFQGYYKLPELGYQVLPDKLESGWNLEFVLRPQPYVESGNTLNMTHDDTDGIFFYMGTRAENKFAQFYNSDMDKYESRDMSKYESYCDSDYFKVDWIDPDADEESKVRFLREFVAFMFKRVECSIVCNGNRNTCNCNEDVDEINSNKNDKKEVLTYLNDQFYLEDDEELEKLVVKTSEGDDAEKRGYYEIITDNKFLTYNRAKGGFTTDKDNPEYIKLYDYKHDYDENIFLTVNRAKSGKTVDDLEKEKDEGDTSLYRIENDITNNAFALRIRRDGSIGYRYLDADCHNEVTQGFAVLEEYSRPNVVKYGEWQDINVKIFRLSSPADECANPLDPRKIKIYFYVSGKLVFISKELPEFNFRALDDRYNKQLAVPYSISLGGGSQGLLESMWLNFHTVFEKILPIEKYFAGTFIGDIKSFKFYTCPLDFLKIRNNYLFEEKKWKTKQQE